MGDGTSSVVILAAELLRGAERLVVNGSHPASIARGLQSALELTLTEIDKLAVSVLPQDMEQVLENIASTSGNSKITSSRKRLFADIATGAARSVPAGIGRVHIVKRCGAGMADSRLIGLFSLC